jgi:hypothetical protein
MGKARIFFHSLRKVGATGVGYLCLFEELELYARFADSDLSFVRNDRAEQVQLQQVGWAVNFHEDVGCDNVVVCEGGGAGELHLHAHNTICLAPTELWSQGHNVILAIRTLFISDF